MRPRSTVCRGRGASGGLTSRLNVIPAVLDVESPFLVEFFMVQGMGFKCMAYRNRDGKWRGAFDNEELPGSIRIME
jgi:hypothetical protein